LLNPETNELRTLNAAELSTVMNSKIEILPCYRRIGTMNGDAAETGGLEAFPDEDQVFIGLYDSAEFAEFEQEMDEMLAALVGRWAHLAAPSAVNARLRRGGIGASSKKKAT